VQLEVRYWQFVARWQLRRWSDLLTTNYQLLTTNGRLPARPGFVATELREPARADGTGIHRSTPAGHAADATKTENDDAQGDSDRDGEEDAGIHEKSSSIGDRRQRIKLIS
jgi:hypothetical protein